MHFPSKICSSQREEKFFIIILFTCGGTNQISFGRKISVASDRSDHRQHRKKEDLVKMVAATLCQQHQAGTLAVQHPGVRCVYQRIKWWVSRMSAHQAARLNSVQGVWQVRGTTGFSGATATVVQLSPRRPCFISHFLLRQFFKYKIVSGRRKIPFTLYLKL